MMKCKYVITNDINPYRNLATEQFLMNYVSEGMFLLFLWQNDNTVVIGRNQDAYKECLVEELRKDGGCVARRRSGGGAVYHDMGNLNYSILTHQRDGKKISYQWILETALNQIGIDTEYNGRNDIICQGKKISGNAMYEERDICCQHGTILVSSNIQRMSRLLTPERGKLDRNHVSSVESRVMNLNEISLGITVESVKKALLTVCEGKPLEYEYQNTEINTLMNFYASKEWIYGGIR